MGARHAIHKKNKFFFDKMEGRTHFAHLTMEQVVDHVLNDPIDPENVKWYEICDYLFGRNYKTVDYATAVALARLCEHRDAKWLCNVADTLGKNHTLETFMQLQDRHRKE